MTKKMLNQNAKYDQRFLDKVEPKFEFSNKPINRLKIVKENSVQNKKGKEERILRLKKKINSIEDCNLRNNSKNLVMGDGDINSPIMLIGEAPDEKEDLEAKTFCGDVGVLLNKMLLAIKIKREKVYSTYSINFRPPNDRKPTTQEIKRYSIFLKEHISIIDPKILILMGTTAMEAVTGLSNQISNERGNWKEIIIGNKTIPAIVTFNPSYLIRYPGSLVGPVYAAAVILKKSINTKLLKDSKSISSSKRKVLFSHIKKNSIWAIGKASLKEIEQLNILNASLLAMKRAIKKLKKKPSHVLIDGNKLPELKNYKLKSIIKGDQKIPSISAASIIAKVTRDKMISNLSKKFKGYSWQKNFGYGTSQHLKAIKVLGITKHHRKNFSPINRLK